VLIATYKKKTAENIKEIKTQRNILEISEKRLFQMAYYDSLTGLHNKDMFEEQLNKSIDEAKNISMLGIVFLDLDSFKSVNDTMGHPTGDYVLKIIANRLSSCLRAEDTIARFGGDEFLILIKNIKSYDELKKVTSRIMDVFEEPMVVQDIEYFITASAGVSVYPVDGENSETLIKNADIAMYRAKTCGKNQCIYCSPMIKDETITKMKLTNSLYRALDRNELYLNYQPQISAETQEIIGFEALLRWNNKEHGLVSPNIFIPMAEQTGLIRQIGLWTIKTACEDFKSFKKCYDKDIILSINLSIEQLKDNNIAEKINKILFDTETDAKDIQIEITESIAFNEDPNILQRLKDIRNLGIKISIDDFGKGYSSFNRLKTFPIDLLKIDMDFVRGITAPSKKDRAIIKSIIQIAKNLNIEVLAEGVETKEQYTYLKYNGCDMIQGYYFYKPMPANEIESLISNPPGIKIS
jgi:diguanylate cyclase (GGDEF)-like protein